LSKTDTYENSILNLLLAAKAIANIADNAASGALTAIQVSLHTADPGESGSQNTSEATYSGYARVATSRTTAGWVVSSGSAAPVAEIVFPQSVSTSTSTITHFGLGASTAGAGTLYYSGTVSPNINISQNVTPSLTTGSSITEA
jgi:hypothetical protein